MQPLLCWGLQRGLWDFLSAPFSRQPLSLTDSISNTFLFCSLALDKAPITLAVRACVFFYFFPLQVFFAPESDFKAQIKSSLSPSLRDFHGFPELVVSPSQHDILSLPLVICGQVLRLHIIKSHPRLHTKCWWPRLFKSEHLGMGSRGVHIDVTPSHTPSQFR